MSLPTLPVYYGDPLVPNITSTPSFVRASDFATPEDLAKYLIYLSETPEEYNKYHAWRKKKNPFDDYFLQFMRDKIAGPIEVEKYMNLTMQDSDNHELNLQFAQRRAQCCRLCDAEFVEQLRKTRNTMVEDSWTPERIDKEFFAGTMYKVHPKERLN